MRSRRAESREWRVTSGVGSYASGTVAGLLTRRYHGILVAALQPPIGRTVLVAKVDEILAYDGAEYPLSTNRWCGGTVDPHGYLNLESFSLEGTIPVWRFAGADALLEKRIWMTQGTNTGYIRYQLIRACGPVMLSIKALVNYRDYHGTTHGAGWRMRIEPIKHGLRIDAYAGAVPFYLLSDQAQATPAQEWYYSFELAIEQQRGFDPHEDILYAGAFSVRLAPGQLLLEPMADHLSAAGLGTLSEIFDGDPPLSPRGCIAQAWSVAEILRAWQAIHRFTPSPSP